MTKGGMQQSGSALLLVIILIGLSTGWAVTVWRSTMLLHETVQSYLVHVDQMSACEKLLEQGIKMVKNNHASPAPGLEYKKAGDSVEIHARTTHDDSLTCHLSCIATPTIAHLTDDTSQTAVIISAWTIHEK